MKDMSMTEYFTGVNSSLTSELNENYRLQASANEILHELSDDYLVQANLIATARSVATITLSTNTLSSVVSVTTENTALVTQLNDSFTATGDGIKGENTRVDELWTLMNSSTSSTENNPDATDRYASTSISWDTFSSGVNLTLASELNNSFDNIYTGMNDSGSVLGTALKAGEKMAVDESIAVFSSPYLSVHTDVTGTLSSSNIDNNWSTILEDFSSLVMIDGNNSTSVTRTLVYLDTNSIYNIGTINLSTLVFTSILRIPVASLTAASTLISSPYNTPTVLSTQFGITDTSINVCQYIKLVGTDTGATVLRVSSLVDEFSLEGVKLNTVSNTFATFNSSGGDSYTLTNSQVSRNPNTQYVSNTSTTSSFGFIYNIIENEVGGPDEDWEYYFDMVTYTNGGSTTIAHPLLVNTGKEDQLISASNAWHMHEGTFYWAVVIASEDASNDEKYDYRIGKSVLSTRTTTVIKSGTGGGLTDERVAIASDQHLNTLYLRILLQDTGSGKGVVNKILQVYTDETAIVNLDSAGNNADPNTLTVSNKYMPTGFEFKYTQLDGGTTTTYNKEVNYAGTSTDIKELSDLTGVRIDLYYEESGLPKPFGITTSKITRYYNGTSTMSYAVSPALANTTYDTYTYTKPFVNSLSEDLYNDLSYTVNIGSNTYTSMSWEKIPSAISTATVNIKHSGMPVSAYVNKYIGIFYQ